MTRFRNVISTGVGGIFQKSTLYLSGIILFVLIAIVLVNFTEKYNYATDMPFLVVTNYSVGPDDYRNMYDRNIAIHNDGSLVLYTTESESLIIGDDAPVLEMQLNDEQIKHVKKVIKEERFLKLSKDISTPRRTGSFNILQ